MEEATEAFLAVRVRAGGLEAVDSHQRRALLSENLGDSRQDAGESLVVQHTSEILIQDRLAQRPYAPSVEHDRAELVR